MRCMDLLLIALVVTIVILSAGCTQSLQPARGSSIHVTTQVVSAKPASRVTAFCITG
jgi:hypothetical protein